MHVLVGIGVIQRQPGIRERLKLRPDFRRQLSAKAGPEEIIDPQPQLIRWEIPIGIHQIRNDRWREYSRPLDRHQMQPDLQPWHGPSTTDRVGGGGGGDHQAGVRQNPVAMGALHRFVHRLRQPEIVRRENNLGGQIAIA